MSFSTYPNRNESATAIPNAKQFGIICIKLTPVDTVDSFRLIRNKLDRHIKNTNEIKIVGICLTQNDHFGFIKLLLIFMYGQTPTMNAKY